MKPTDSVLSRALDLALRAVRRARARVLRFVRKNRFADAGQLLARVQAEIGNSEPAVAKAIEKGIVAAWVGAQLDPARDATPDPTPGELLDVEPPFVPPTPPTAYAGAEEPEGPRVRFPGIEAAVRDLMARKIVTADEFLALSEDAQAAAFTVARVTTADAVEAVRNAIARDLAGGGGLREFRRVVGPLLDEAGYTENMIETLYRTQTAQASAVGQQAVLDHPMVADGFPYVMWSATHDSRVRPDHLAMERSGIQGTAVYRCDDPKLRAVWPPCGYNCRCVVIPLSIEDAAAEGIYEAREWLKTGLPPEVPEYVDSVPVELPPGWPGAGQVEPVRSG